MAYKSFESAKDKLWFSRIFKLNQNWSHQTALIVDSSFYLNTIACLQTMEKRCFEWHAQSSWKASLLAAPLSLSVLIALLDSLDSWEDIGAFFSP